MKHPYQQLFEDLASHFTQQSNFLKHADLQEEFSVAGKLSHEEALQVYQNAYLSRLTEALGEKYQNVWRYLGDEEFFALCEKYILTHPSQAFELGMYGEDFPAYLITLKKEDLLVDIAQLDRLYLEVFHAPAPTHNSQAQFQALADGIETARVQRIASARVFSSQYPIFEIWTHLKKSQWQDAEPRAQHVLLYKNEGQVYLKEVSKSFVELFSLLEEHENINSALEAFEKTFPEREAQEVQKAFEVFLKTNVLFFTKS